MPRTPSSIHTLVSTSILRRLETFNISALANTQSKQGTKKEVPALKVLQFML